MAWAMPWLGGSGGGLRYSPSPAPSPVGAAGMGAPGLMAWAGSGQQLLDSHAARLGIHPAPNLVPGGLLETPTWPLLGGCPLPLPSTKTQCPLGGLPAASSLFCSLDMPVLPSLWERSSAGLSPPSSSPSPTAHHRGIRPHRAHFHLPSCLRQAASVPLRATPCDAWLGWGTRATRLSISTVRGRLGGPCRPSKAQHKHASTPKRGGLRCYQRRISTNLMGSQRGSWHLNTRPTLPGRLVGANPINFHPGRRRSRGNGFG